MDETDETAESLTMQIDSRTRAWWRVQRLQQTCSPQSPLKKKKKKKSTSGGSAKAARRRSALLAIHRHAGSSVVHLEIVDTDGEYWMHISECSAFFSPSPSLQVVATSCTPYLRSWRTRGTLLQRIIRRPHATSCSGVSHPTCLSSLSYIWLCFCSKSH